LTLFENSSVSGVFMPANAMRWSLLLALLLAGCVCVSADVLSTYSYGGCPFFVSPNGVELLWNQGPCRGNPACHAQCVQGTDWLRQDSRCGTFLGGATYCSFATYGSRGSTSIDKQQDGALAIRCLGDDQPALAAGTTSTTNTPGSQPEGDSFAGFTCYVNGEKAVNDPQVLAPNNFCQYCTSMARQYHCSNNGIVKRRTGPCPKIPGIPQTFVCDYAFDSTAMVCTCDNQWVGYTDFRRQCTTTVRAKFCSGHGDAPVGTTYPANVAASGVKCICDLGWGGTNCGTPVGCPCGTFGACGEGSTTCQCNAQDGYGGQYCCPVIAGKVCNGHGTCTVGGVCVCEDGWTGQPGCLPTYKGCDLRTPCPLCQAEGIPLPLPGTACPLCAYSPMLTGVNTQGYRVLGTYSSASGTCGCYGDGTTGFTQIAFNDGTGRCAPYCPSLVGATNVQCGGHGKCANDGTKTLHTCKCDDDTGVGAAIVAYRLDATTGLCCPAYPLTGRTSDIGFPTADGTSAGYFVCGARGVCSPATGGCVWNAGRAAPYGCPINQGQAVVCNGQTCQRDGTCNCNTGTTNLAGPTCQLNVACNPSDTSAECKSGGTCTTYSTSVVKLVNDLGFIDDPTVTFTAGTVTLRDEGVYYLVRHLYTLFAGYNATHADFSKATFWQSWKNLCEPSSGAKPTHSACLESVINTFVASNGVARGRARFSTDTAYIQDILVNRFFTTASVPAAPWQTAFSVGLSAGATNAQRLNSIMGLLAYYRLYDWNTGTPPTFTSDYGVLCNCTAFSGDQGATISQFVWDLSNTRIGRGGLQCEGSCPVSRHGLVCGGIYRGVHRGHCLSNGKCECDLLWTGPSCTVPRTPCVNTSIVPNQLCNGRTDAQCIVNAANTAMQCKCPPAWTGQYCELTACPTPASPTYAQKLVECSGYGTCAVPGLTCSCDVAGQLAALGSSASASNKPRLPYGSACEFNGIDDCGTFRETNPITHTGVWSECNGHGTCARSGGAGVCVCNAGFSGSKCTIQACANCTATQTCNVKTGQCQCRTMWTGANCTTSRCVHGVPTAAGTACTCDAYWSIDPSTGLCTIPYCAPTYIDSVLGTSKCTGAEPICVNSAQYQAGGCCRAVCTQCKYNASISATPYCVCGNSLLQIQTQGICKDRCGGGVATLVNGVVDCDCAKVELAIGPNRYVSDYATCGSIVSCLNGGTSSGQSCVCINGYSGTTCQLKPCGTIAAQGYRDDFGACVCSFPFTMGWTTVAPDGVTIIEWGTVGGDENACNANMCTLSPSFDANDEPFLAHGALVKDSRYSLWSEYVESRQSGYACVCPEDEACQGPRADAVVQGIMTFEQFRNQPCTGGCAPLTEPLRTLNTYGTLGLFHAIVAVGDHGGARATAVIDACATLYGAWASSLVARRGVSIRNHTLWCNMTAYNITHRTGQLGYDYLCENGGVRVKTAYVNGACQCPFGNVDNSTCKCPKYDFGRYVSTQNCPSDAFRPRCGDGKQRCVCPFAYNGTYCEKLRCRHGRASADRSRCICNAGWSGPLCSSSTPGTSTGVDVSSSSSTGGDNATVSSSSSTAAAGNGTEPGNAGRPSVATIGTAVTVVSVAVVGAAAAASVAGVNAVVAASGAISAVTSAGSATAQALGIARHAVSTAQAVAPLATGQASGGTALSAASAATTWVP
jgi:hypothetical protein